MSSYTWRVYPVRSDAAMIATGISSDPARARSCVEQVLGSHPDGAAWGLLLGPDAAMDVCRRARDGGYHWGPLFPAVTAEGAPGPSSC